ncbi:MAG TPA: hypothetical protein VEG38_21085 [Acidimicrobiia bacterium]|nr:hypothetical protein [Acidimicrobiia bacterium]
MLSAFEVVAGKQSAADAPAQQPMRPAKLRRNPDADQRKVRRQQARQNRKTAADDIKPGDRVTVNGEPGIVLTTDPNSDNLGRFKGTEVSICVSLEDGTQVCAAPSQVRKQARQNRKTAYWLEEDIGSPVFDSGPLPPPTEACPNCGTYNTSDYDPALDAEYEEFDFTCLNCGTRYYMDADDGTVHAASKTADWSWGDAQRTETVQQPYPTCPECGSDEVSFEDNDDSDTAVASEEWAACPDCGWVGSTEDVIMKESRMATRRTAGEEWEEDRDDEDTDAENPDLPWDEEGERKFREKHPEKFPQAEDEDEEEDDSNEKEARLLRAMAKASLQEQRALALELDALRRRRAHRRIAAREMDLASAHVRDCLTPVAVHEMNTTATDWLSEVADSDFEAVPDQDMGNEVVTQATLWFRRASAEVKADRDEFAEQAMGKARQIAGRYGERAPIARRAFLDHVAHLHRFATSGSELTADPSGQGQSKLPHEVPLSGNEETFDEDFWADAPAEVSSERAPVIQENKEGRRRTAGEVPPEFKEQQKPKGDGSDDGDDKPDWLKEKIESRRKVAETAAEDWPLDKGDQEKDDVDDWFTDEDKLTTGDTRDFSELPGVKSRRRTAAPSKADESGQGVSSLPDIEVGGENDRPMWPWELEGEVKRGEDASDVANVATPGANGYPQPSGDRGKKTQSRRVIAEEGGGGQTCSVCGDPIERDPGHEDPQTWHHNNGEKHDHEASPGGGDKEARRRQLAFRARVQANMRGGR